jgi:hypothetical protein
MISHRNALRNAHVEKAGQLTRVHVLHGEKRGGEGRGRGLGRERVRRPPETLPRPAGGSGPGRASPYTALSSTFIPVDRHERPDANHGDARFTIMCFLSQHRQFVGPSTTLSVPYDITFDP